MLNNNAGDMMTRKVLTASPDETVAAVAQIMAKHDVSALPVCDANGQLVGIISEGDLMRPFASRNEGHRAWWLSLLAEGTDLAPNFLDDIRREHWHVRSLMSTPVITAVESTTLAELADLFISRRIKRVPILREGKVIGIISRSDIIRALAREKETPTS